MVGLSSDSVNQENYNAHKNDRKIDSADTFNNATNGYTFALVSLTTLFFMWGFITCLNDILIPHLKSAFSLSYTQAMLIQFCFFGAYFIVSLPAGNLVKHLGYQNGIVVGLIVAAIGCLLFYPAAAWHTYALFLGALFILAAGITILQVSANPYVTALGKPATASSRLSLTQAFNSLGTTIAPFFGSILILGSADAGLQAMSETTPEQQAASVQIPYLLLGSVLIGLAVIFKRLNLPALGSGNKQEAPGAAAVSTSDTHSSAWTYPHLVLGAVGIFVYVGAEVSIGSFLVNFLGEDNIAGMEEAQAATYVAYYWGGAMVGRFIGAAVMRHINPGKVLTFNALCAALLVLLAIVASGATAMWSILMVGLFNSIMFPTIFSLALQGLGRHTSQGSGILCLAIVGGALVPLAQGALADGLGIQLAFALPIVCYLYIAYFGLNSVKLS